MNRITRLWIIGATGLLLPTDASAQVPVESTPVVAKTKTNEFIRTTRDAEQNPLALQTAITSFKSPRGSGDLVVDLVGAVHVGDKEYYSALNTEFEQYDSVLFELVAPRGTVIPKGGRKGGGNPISMLQGMTKNMLNLSSQMEEIDYTKKNFVHADMSPDEMQKVMSKRGETPVTVALDALSEMIKSNNLRQQNNPQAAPIQQLTDDPFSLMFDAQRDVKLKKIMADQFATMGVDAMGNTINRVLIEDRNQAAMRVLKSEVAKGHDRIAIFYGAAHLPDFEKRLKSDYNLERAETKWLTAWDLTKPSKHKKDDPVDNLFRSLLRPNAE